MTDKEVANSVDLEISDFSDDGTDIDELRDIIEGRKTMKKHSLEIKMEVF